MHAELLRAANVPPQSNDEIRQEPHTNPRNVRSRLSLESNCSGYFTAAREAAFRSPSYPAATLAAVHRRCSYFTPGGRGRG